MSLDRGAAIVGRDRSAGKVDRAGDAGKVGRVGSACRAGKILELEKRRLESYVCCEVRKGCHISTN